METNCEINGTECCDTDTVTGCCMTVHEQKEFFLGCACRAMEAMCQGDWECCDTLAEKAFEVAHAMLKCCEKHCAEACFNVTDQAVN